MIIALIIGEVVCGVIVKSVNGDDPFFGKVGRAGFNFVAGLMFCEVIPYLIEDSDDFIDEMYWVGKLLCIAGIVGFVFCLFEVLKSIDKKLTAQARSSAPSANVPISEHVGRTEVKKEAQTSAEAEKKAPATSYVCTECGNTVTQVPCPSCGHIAYPMEPIYVDEYIMECPVCHKRQLNTRITCNSCNQQFINGQKDIPYWCKECGMPGPFSDGICPNCRGTNKIENKRVTDKSKREEISEPLIPDNGVRFCSVCGKRSNIDPCDECSGKK